MTVILHPPEGVSFSGDPISAEDQARIGQALRAAVQRVVDNAARRSAPRSLGAAPSNQKPQETFDPARADLAQGIYRVPSYQDEGQLSGVKLLESIPKAAPGYDVKAGPSPLEGALIMTLPGLHYILLRSPRYVTAGTLTQAYLLGQVVFGAASFAIAQGPIGSPDMRYWAVGTDPVVSDEDLGREVPIKTRPGEEALPPELVGANVVVGAELSVRLGREGLYMTRGFVTKESVHWRARPMAELWFAQLEAEHREGVRAPPVGKFRHLVFAEIDQFVAQFEAGDDANLQRAAEQLSLLDWRAFSLVDWQTKAGYLKVLLAADTWQVEEVAVVQIFQSLRSDSEVDAVIAMLKEAGRYDQLFDDLDDELYDLLVTVGERFPKDNGPLTFDGLVRLLQSLGLLPRSVNDALISGAFAGPAASTLKAISDGRSVTGAMYDEAHDAVMGLVRLNSDLWHSAESIITEPGKVIGGVKGLAQLLYEVQMASMGYQPAIEKITNMLRAVGEKGLAGMRGADRLGCGEKVVRRIKWRLVWEIATLFVGVGEVKALIEVTGLSEKLAGVLRFLTVLARLGEAADLEVEGTRLARLASILKAERAAFASVEEAAELLSRLPEKDMVRLGKLISKIDIREGETLAELATRSPELHAAVEDAIAKTELLKTMAGKAGGLTEEMVEAFHVLIGDDGLPLADAQKVVSAIPQGEGGRFAATLKRMPVGNLAEGSRAAFLELLAASTSRMDAVARLGYDTFASIYRRAGGRGEMVDHYLAALNDIEDRLARAGIPGEFRRLLDRLERDDPATWLDVENTRRLRAGERAISDWAAAVSGSPRAQQGLDMLLRGGHEDLAAEIMDTPDQVTVIHQLGPAGELTPKQIDGLAAIKQAEIDFGGDMGIHGWADLLDVDPDIRDDLLELVADVEGSVDDGLDLAIKRGLSGGKNVQGTLGHFYAARTLKERFPGARFRFELPGVRREIDIEMSYQGRLIDVEVKTNLGLEPSISNAQIRKDLEKHIGDRWDNMLYLYAPQQVANLAGVERAMLRALRVLDTQNKLPIALVDAEKLLRARFAASPPWRLVDVFTY